MAEKKGFEPLIPLWGIHDFQSCALDQLRDFSVFAQVNMLFNYQLGYYNSQATQSQAFFCPNSILAAPIIELHTKRLVV